MNPETMSDTEMTHHLDAGNVKFVERKWNDEEESNAGTIAILEESSGICQSKAGGWLSDGRGGWNKA